MRFIADFRGPNPLPGLVKEYIEREIHLSPGRHVAALMCGGDGSDDLTSYVVGLK
jgi:hypothetical protein